MISRAETGAMQFGDDWPGVFIRGDDAHFFGHQLASVLASTEAPTMDPIARFVLEGLRDTLLACDVRKKPTPSMLAEYAACLASKR